FSELGLPPISDDEVKAAAYGYDSRDVPDRDRAADVGAADRVLAEGISGLDGTVHSAVNDPNDYRGPGTGYRLEGERWALLQALPHEADAAAIGRPAP